MIKSVVFDIDGTILNTEYADLTALKETIYELKKERVELSELAFVLGIPGEVALKKLGIEDTKSGNHLWSNYMVKYAHTIKLYEGIEEVIKELKSRGYKLGIVTSKNKNEYQNDFAPFELDHYFDTIIRVEDSDRPKPSPDPMLKYLELSRTNKDEAIYIGDTIYDMQCANAAGVEFGLALWGCHSAENIQAAYYFNSPNDILHALSVKKRSRFCEVTEKSF